ncbi:TetR/AcrR family transcriptional regulator [Streptomyces iconiensis]|uniref:TetR/AcrR family transcriptional regulator n=1 Tax=Streptomyces iconiensis TaxID=1384038 RepID=A0ABT6ZTK5_9ACTN|nr:TetR/AcrR family transcriptional regulator [Streptomyces iconiensis]MDJ1132389.1 TetR/AcrR family transcriptional regulator [Streptomyces iconiensis]
MNETSSRRRAPAMDPDQRRAMIITAALPLVVEYGASVTTAKIARAAGIGEGTIFRVFPDKDAVLQACMEEVLRPDDTVALLEAISVDQPLSGRLIEAAEVMRGRMHRIGDVAGALAATGKLTRGAPPGPDSGTDADPDAAARQREASLAAPRAVLAALFEPERDRLRLAPERLADAFHLLLMSAGRMGAPDPLENAELVDLFLHGAVVGDAE